VTAALRVNASTHNPLLCVTDVFKVASGNLSLPAWKDRPAAERSPGANPGIVLLAWPVPLPDSASLHRFRQVAAG